MTLKFKENEVKNLLNQMGMPQSLKSEYQKE